MAFHPFRAFWKYKKIWLVALTGLTMISFIVCSGSGVDETFRNLIYRFAGKSTAVAELYGSNVTRTQLEELKKERKIANEFMRAATEIAIHNANGLIEQSNKKIEKTVAKYAGNQHAEMILKQAIKLPAANRDEYLDGACGGDDALRSRLKADLKKIEVYQVDVGKLQSVRSFLIPKLKESSYFGSSTEKLEDLLDFMIWVRQADNLAVYLDQKSVGNEIFLRVFGQLTYYTRDAALEAERKVQSLFPRISSEAITAALTQEFRVEIAKLALSGVRTEALLHPGYPTVAMQTRMPLTPDQLWRDYQEKLTEFDVALLPVRVEDFVAKTKKPSEPELQQFFKKYQSRVSDPASDEPGLVTPEKTQVQYVTADPKSDYYKKYSHGVTILESSLPALLPSIGNAVRVAVDQPVRDLHNYEIDKKTAAQGDTKFTRQQISFNKEGLLGQWESSLERETTLPFFAQNSFPYLQVPLTSPNFDLPMYSIAAEITGEIKPIWVAGVVGNGALPGLFSFGPANYYAAIAFDQKEKLKTAVQKEIDQRLPLASIVLDGAGPTPFPALWRWDNTHRKITYMPLEVFAGHYRKRRAAILAVAQARKAMEETRDFITKKNGNRREVLARLKKMKEKYPGIEIYPPLDDEKTNEAHSIYNIADAPELKGFKRVFQNPRVLSLFNYIEGRKGSDGGELKQDEFDKLFFEQTEMYSVASRGDYFVLSWPPVATTPKARSLIENPQQLQALGVSGVTKSGVPIDMWLLPHAEQLVLFWKTGHEPRKRPENLDKETRERAVKAWRYQRARSLALAEAKKIAEKLEKDFDIERAFLPSFEKAAQARGATLLQLKNVSPWKSIQRPDGVKYGEYAIPKDFVAYPREDMAKQVLDLDVLKKPLKMEAVATDKENPLEAQAESQKNIRNLDDVNKKLFQKKLKPGIPQVQILTNRPLSEYYIAAVVKTHPAPKSGFNTAYLGAAAGGGAQNLFVAKAQLESAKRHQEALMQHLRQEAGLQNVNAKAFQ